jgi:hypothetical protein
MATGVLQATDREGEESQACINSAEPFTGSLPRT